MAEVATKAAESGFFSGFTANNVLDFGLNVFSNKVASDGIKATKAETDLIAAQYAAQAQRTALNNGSIIGGVDNKILIGGAVLFSIALIFILKGK